jgi:hypothetical protein
VHGESQYPRMGIDFDQPPQQFQSAQARHVAPQPGLL